MCILFSFYSNLLNNGHYGCIMTWAVDMPKTPIYKLQSASMDQCMIGQFSFPWCKHVGRNLGSSLKQSTKPCSYLYLDIMSYQCISLLSFANIEISLWLSDNVCLSFKRDTITCYIMNYWGESAYICTYTFIMHDFQICKRLSWIMSQIRIKLFLLALSSSS